MPELFLGNFVIQKVAKSYLSTCEECKITIYSDNKLSDFEYVGGIVILSEDPG